MLQTSGFLIRILKNPELAMELYAIIYPLFTSQIYVRLEPVFVKVLSVIASLLNPECAKQLFDLIKLKIFENESKKFIEDYCIIIKKLLKYSTSNIEISQNLNLPYFFEQSMQIIQSFFEGSLPFLNNQSPFQNNDVDYPILNGISGIICECFEKIKVLPNNEPYKAFYHEVINGMLQYLETNSSNNIQCVSFLGALSDIQILFDSQQLERSFQIVSEFFGRQELLLVNNCVYFLYKLIDFPNENEFKQITNQYILQTMETVIELWNNSKEIMNGYQTFIGQTICYILKIMRNPIPITFQEEFLLQILHFLPLNNVSYEWYYYNDLVQLIQYIYSNNGFGSNIQENYNFKIELLKTLIRYLNINQLKQYKIQPDSAKQLLHSILLSNNTLIEMLGINISEVQ